MYLSLHLAVACSPARPLQGPGALPSDQGRTAGQTKRRQAVLRRRLYCFLAACSMPLNAGGSPSIFIYAGYIPTRISFPHKQDYSVSAQAPSTCTPLDAGRDEYNNLYKLPTKARLLGFSTSTFNLYVHWLQTSRLRPVVVVGVMK